MSSAVSPVAGYSLFSVRIGLVLISKDKSSIKMYRWWVFDSWKYAHKPFCDTGTSPGSNSMDDCA